MNESPFRSPTFQCRSCGREWEGHGRYCHPIADRLLIFAVVVCMAALLVAFWSLVYVWSVG
jgi:hypothetical protein